MNYLEILQDLYWNQRIAICKEKFVDGTWVHYATVFNVSSLFYDLQDELQFS